MRCLRGPLYSMEAELVPPDYEVTEIPDGSPSGYFESYQDPLTFEILRRWVPTDDPETPEDESGGRTALTFPCMARGIIDGGIRVAGTTERFGDTYENIDYVRLKVPAHVRITKRDRVTNIREKKGGIVLWRDEEGDGKPTIFNVNGVTPVLDGFNRHIENFVLLERAD